MKRETINVNGMQIDVYTVNTVIVGTGIAGFNAADSLHDLGQKDIAIVTEGINMGTSRNAGSDKQTYYKLTLAGDIPDSVLDMAKTLYNGGSMHGDIALVEAALSARCFFKLVNIGVPFPHNEYGEYVGYKTDHDPRQRATSCGPLTSKIITEKLEQQVKRKGIRIFDGHMVIGIITSLGEGSRQKNAIGVVALDTKQLHRPNMGLVVFNCTNIIYATGGPAGLYLDSVYPESQTGAMGIAFEAGVRGINLTESQYGIASIKFRWNLSGTYQQVLPRYISTNPDGSDEREFLNDYFKSAGKMLDAIFLKGYQWPFDVRKIKDSGSSVIDIAVYNEIQRKRRRVFLDYTKNTSWGSNNGEMDFSLLGQEAYTYLKNSGVLFGTPLQRLQKMNQPAIELYKNNGIDLRKEYLEISVCAQHNNGGLVGDVWWESNVKHFFPVGEASGVFGVYRPGGSALNSAMAGSLRAAQYICSNYYSDPLPLNIFIELSLAQIEEKIKIAKNFTQNISTYSNIWEMRRKLQQRMTKAGAFVRSYGDVKAAILECMDDIESLYEKTKLSSIYELPHAFKNRDLLTTQYVYLNAVKEYVQRGGKSRGSFIIKDNNGDMVVPELEDFRFSLDEGQLSGWACEIELVKEDNDLKCLVDWKPARPIPEQDNWFENVWNNYRNSLR